MNRLYRGYMVSGIRFSPKPNRASETSVERKDEADCAGSGQEVDASIVDVVSRAVVESYAYRHECFGSRPKYPATPAVKLLLNMHQSTGDSSYRFMAESALDGMMNDGPYDQEGDDFFRYSTTGDWPVSHYEKTLEDSVGLLRLYLHGYLVTGNESYARVASRMVDYLNDHLYDGTSGAFYGSQGDREKHYSNPITERKELSSPEAAPVFYTGMNARVASAYLEAAWVLNRPNLADVGLETVDYLLQRCQKGPLCRIYSSSGGEVRTPALLTDYAHIVIALVDAYDRASSPRYLDEAKRLAGEMCDFFWDEQGGGFFDAVEDQDAREVRDKPISDNVVAIEALIRLFSYTHDEEYRNAAEAALSAFVPVYREYGEAAAGYALAVHRFLYSPVEVTVVGAPGGADTRAMITAAANIPYPNTTIKYVDSDDDERMAEAGYWAGSEAQAYVCLGTLCLAPVSDPETLHQTVLEFLEAGVQDTGSIIQTISDL